MGQAKVSVIIPVYNAEMYLCQCLDSLLNQTLRDIEIICVDDGSTDGSLEMLYRYEAQDARVKVLRQKNQYAGVARNNGMAVARGEYYIFLDADDFFEPELLELMYKKGCELEADLILCDADRFNVGSGKFETMSWFLSKDYIKEQPLNRNRIPTKIFQLNSLEPWNKMVSARFVAKHSLRFQHLPRANDVYFSMLSLALAERIAAVDKVLVHYRVGMSTNLQAKNHLSPLAFGEALTAVKRRLAEEGLYDTVWQSFAENALSQLLYNLKKLLGCPGAYRILRNTIKDCYMVDFDIARGMSEGTLNEHGTKELVSLLENPPYQPLQISEESLPDVSASPLVSVIIPVYNVEKYLSECLDSVVGQTLRNIEIICVNDGSPDGSATILSAYAEKDSRIRIVNRENGGLSAARNSGFAVAEGEYIYFLDSDDLLECDALETLYKVSKANNLDILHFDHATFYDNGQTGKAFSRKGHSVILDGVGFMKRLKDCREYTAVVWGQFFNHSFLLKHKLLHYPGIIHEDEHFTFFAHMNAQRVSHLRRQFYRYRLRDTSIMGVGKSAKNVTGYFTCMREMLSYGLSAKHDAEKAAEIFRAVMAMQEKSKQYYGWIDAEEKVKLRFDDPVSMLLFEKLVLEMDGFSLSAGTSSGENTQVLALVNRTLTQELEDVRTSASYRIGRFITWIPRKIQGLIRCWKDHGPGYTWERIMAHFKQEG